ncbi:hypothetical protein CALCODRAFT_258832 [Calocera cornea HHB12733]|uniref:Uncharacterized protein n=1 Tax=Calocera cornea HHB12733 TaxID=1353952 RepID=A0A165GL68_9BASI|nr:hypothetical protein CALCODRAFT_258832 [Calocera cornea HHB12733]
MFSFSATPSCLQPALRMLLRPAASRSSASHMLVIRLRSCASSHPGEPRAHAAYEGEPVSQRGIADYDSRAFGELSLPAVRNSEQGVMEVKREKIPRAAGDSSAVTLAHTGGVNCTRAQAPIERSADATAYSWKQLRRPWCSDCPSLSSPHAPQPADLLSSCTGARPSAESR